MLFDVGDPFLCCGYCGAKIWLEEHVDKIRSETNAKFYFCCLKENIYLPHLKKPLELLYSLLHGGNRKSRHYSIILGLTKI